MNRITEKMIDRRIDHLNRITQSPGTTWTKKQDGRMSANINNFHLSQAYGGNALHRVMNESGGVDDIFNCGYVTKREIFNRINAYINGYSDCLLNNDL